MAPIFDEQLIKDRVPFNPSMLYKILHSFWSVYSLLEGVPAEQLPISLYNRNNQLKDAKNNAGEVESAISAL